MNELIILPKKTVDDVPAIEAPEKPFIDAGSPAWKPNFKSLAAPVGAIALVLGIGWTVAARIDDAKRAGAEQVAARTASESAAEALRAAQSQRQELAALRVNVETLKSKLEAQAQKAHASESTISALQKSLSEQKAEAAAAESQLQARLEKVQTLATEKVDRAPTSAIAKPSPRPSPGSLPNAQPAPQPAALQAQSRPAAVQLSPGLYRAYVLRDVEHGRAVVEGAHGFEEVGPGDVLPGGARVESIERRGVGWIVLTDRGAIAPDGRWDD
jgi:hypothetical protein